MNALDIAIREDPKPMTLNFGDAFSYTFSYETVVIDQDDQYCYVAMVPHDE